MAKGRVSGTKPCDQTFCLRLLVCRLAFGTVSRNNQQARNVRETRESGFRVMIFDGRRLHTAVSGILKAFTLPYLASRYCTQVRQYSPVHPVCRLRYGSRLRILACLLHLGHGTAARATPAGCGSVQCSR